MSGSDWRVWLARRRRIALAQQTHGSQEPWQQAKPAAPLSGSSPIVDLDTPPVGALVDAPPDIAASSDHHHLDVIEVRDRGVVRRLQPGSVGLLSGPGRSELIVDDLLVQPIMLLRHGDVLLHPVNQLLFGIEAEAE